MDARERYPGDVHPDDDGALWTGNVMTALMAMLLAGGQPVLILPVRCAVPRVCIIQKLPDHGPGRARADYRCGSLTTDAHGGTDFRVLDDTAFAAGVPVVAAAAGTVVRERDGEPDVDVRIRAIAKGQDAGNGVVIDHGDGWVTQYSHLRAGSINVRPGASVTAGQAIGMVGLSGNTEYPHLHFDVRHRDLAIDPFDGRSTAAACGLATRETSLWARGLVVVLEQATTAIIGGGLANGFADPVRPRADAARTLLTATLPLLLWSEVSGVRRGDVLRFVITGADGVVFDERRKLDGGHLLWTSFGGRAPPPRGWAAGLVRGEISLWRDGKLVGDKAVTGRVDP